MKLAQDTTQNKVGSALAVGTSSQAGNALAAQTKRGFAESLRHQIDVVAEASQQSLKALKQEANRQPDANKPLNAQPGTDLPAKEQKLPRGNAAKEAMDTELKPEVETKLATELETEHKQLMDRPATQTREYAEAATHATADLSSELSQQGVAADESISDPVWPVNVQAINDPIAEANLGGGNQALALSPISDELKARNGTADLQQPLDIVFTSGYDEGQDQSLLSDSGLSFIIPPVALQQSSIVSESTESLAASLLANLDLESSDLGSEPITAASENLFKLITDSGTLQAITPLSANNTVLAPIALTRPNIAAAELSRQQSTLLQSDISADDTSGGELIFSEKLLHQKQPILSSLQYASMLTQAASPATSLDAPISQGLMSVLASGLQTTAASLDPSVSALLSATLSSDTGSTSSNVVSGLAASAYTLDQRQQTAADARQLQLQNSRGVDTSLATTSALKLPGLNLTFGQAGWMDRIGRQMLLQTAQGLSSAQIRLDPPELGSLTVRIQLVDQSAAVNFVSPHAMVRDALEQQAGRLQEMFREQGMNLLDVSVSDNSAHSGGDGSNEQRSSNGGGAGSAMWVGDVSPGADSSVVRQSESLIDFYA